MANVSAVIVPDRIKRGNRAVYWSHPPTKTHRKIQISWVQRTHPDIFIDGQLLSVDKHAALARKTGVTHREFYTRWRDGVIGWIVP